MQKLIYCAERKPYILLPTFRNSRLFSMEVERNYRTPPATILTYSSRLVHIYTSIHYSYLTKIFFFPFVMDKQKKILTNIEILSLIKSYIISKLSGCISFFNFYHAKPGPGLPGPREPSKRDTTSLTRSY